MGRAEDDARLEQIKRSIIAKELAAQPMPVTELEWEKATNCVWFAGEFQILPAEDDEDGS